ncbi:MAG: OmpH family outer membrane protein [Armatimonadota bacterium]|nr:OmpH family outer membrane protein [Armatimonadota bacterium]MDR5702748.1 OmpH family outer membrane protein [Armatimonadota bacterium]MDR7435178.1 OmpH family outer membrane protein [Armatimonadota bacterium]
MNPKQWIVVGLALVASLALVGCTRPQVGVVDINRVLNESVRALSYQKQLDDREKAMAAELAILASQLSREELEARRALYLRELQQLKAELEARLDQEVRKAAEEVARSKRLRVVLVKGATQLGGVDITNEVIERLK